MKNMNLKKKSKCYLCKANTYQMMYYLKNKRICRDCTAKMLEEVDNTNEMSKM